MSLNWARLVEVELPNRSDGLVVVGRSVGGCGYNCDFGDNCRGVMVDGAPGPLYFDEYKHLRAARADPDLGAALRSWRPAGPVVWTWGQYRRHEWL